MEYISTDDSEKYDIEHGHLTENPLRGSSSRFVTNPIVDDIESADPDAPADPAHPKIEYVPPDCEVLGEPSVNDLAEHRWQGDGLDAETESELIRRIQGGDERAFYDPRPDHPSLLRSFHRSVVGPASKYIPGGTFERRRSKNTKHTNNLLFEDLTSVGCLALWQSAVKFKPGHRFNTLSR
jgi:hypothetical protein